jgi:hypothetical protein
LAFRSLGKNYSYFFDPKHNIDPKLKDAGDFEPHSERYQQLAKLGITLSSASIAFLVGLLANDKSQSPFVQRLAAVAPIAAGFFGTSIALLIFFMLFQTVCYEAYCHSPDHNSYTRRKYAMSYGLGVTGLCSCVIGFTWLAANLFRR